MKKMKKFIIVTMIAACAALCAAVWPHDNGVVPCKCSRKIPKNLLN